MARKYAAPHHAWVDVDHDVRNWRNNYDGDQSAMGNRAGPVRRLADSINRSLGRYPMVWAAMAWPITANGTVSAEQNGSAPLVNFGRFDYVPNARTATIRIAALESGTNATGNIHVSTCGSMSNAMNASSANVDIWTNAPRTCQGIRYDQLDVNRGDASNAWAGQQVNTYGGYTIVDMVAQDDEIGLLDSNSAVHDGVQITGATSARDVTSALPDAMRRKFHAVRMRNHGWQAMWLGYGQSNAWQYPQATNQCSIVTASNTYVNLINQSWTDRNSDSPGVECIAQYRGRGHQGVASGTVVPCTFRALVECNGAGPPGNASINIHGPIDSAYFNVPVNSIAEYSVNVSLNTALDPINVSNGINKLDVFGKVANTGTDTVLVRWFTVQSFTN